MKSPAASREDRGALPEIALEFLRLGLIAYGGAAAHVALMEERFVRTKNWLTRERFLDFFGAASVLPGPSSTELAIYLGEARAGFLGMLVAGGAFILPAAFLAVGLAWAYLKYGSLPQVTGLLIGIKPVVVGLMTQAIWNLGRTALKNLALWALAVTAIVLAAFGKPILLLLLGAGLLWMLIAGVRRGAREQAIFFAGLGGSSLGGAIAAVAPASLFFYFLKVGALIIGSGYVLLAVLREDLVLRLHWLTETQLLDAIAISQATPGPYFTVSTFIGYLLAGWPGAVTATAGMFLPAFVYVGASARFLPRLRQSPSASAFLDGVNAAAVALMGFVGWQFARASLVSWPAMVIAAACLFLLIRYKINSAWLVLGGALAGIALHAARLA